MNIIVTSFFRFNFEVVTVFLSKINVLKLLTSLPHSIQKQQLVETRREKVSQSFYFVSAYVKHIWLAISKLFFSSFD